MRISSDLEKKHSFKHSLSKQIRLVQSVSLSPVRQVKAGLPVRDRMGERRWRGEMETML